MDQSIDIPRKLSTDYWAEHLMRRLFITAILVAGFSEFANSACRQTGYFMITDKISAKELNYSGFLSDALIRQTLNVNCTGAAPFQQLTLNIRPGTPYTGQTAKIDNVTYNLYSAQQDGIAYIVGVGMAGPLNGTTYAVKQRADGLGRANFSIEVYMRTYALTPLKTPGLYKVGASGLSMITAYNNGSIVAVMTLSPTAFTVNGPSCKLNSPTEVRLAPANLARLAGVRSTVEGGTFALGVKCAVGSPTYKVGYSLVDVNNQGNKTSDLTLEKIPGSATGIALQITDGGTALLFNPDSPVALGETSSGGGGVSKIMGVRYVRTSSTANPGIVKGGVAVTISYN